MQEKPRWVKPSFEVIAVSLECTAYAGTLLLFEPRSQEWPGNGKASGKKAGRGR
jgi:hypothetical protein